MISVLGLALEALEKERQRSKDVSMLTIRAIEALRAVSADYLKNPELYQEDLGELILCKDAMNEFCDRVERGEVRSSYTYKKFKELLSR